ncbi:MAG: ribosomal protein S18-alanine N-acetyltransferase [Bdellovibrionota bacterium]
MSYLDYSPRPATEDDIAQIVDIEQGAMRPPWGANSFRAELTKRTSRFWVITDNETDAKVMAYIVFSLPAEQAHIQTFAVKPELKRQGLGKYLLRQVIAFVMRQKGESIVLEVRKSNLAAVSLYQSMGFIVLHTMTKFYPDGEDGYSMIYKIDRTKLSGDHDQDFEDDDGPIGERKNLN